MTITRTYTYENYTELLDGLEDSTAAIKAAAALLEVALRHDESMKQEAAGVWLLFKHHCEDAEYYRDALYKEIEQMRVNKLEVRDIDTVARWACVSPKLAANVVAIATGIRLPESDDAAYKDLVETAQQVSIVRAMQSVADLEAISKAAAVPADTVSRVLDEAYHYNPRRMAAIRNAVEKAREGKGAEHVGA